MVRKNELWTSLEGSLTIFEVKHDQQVQEKTNQPRPVAPVHNSMDVGDPPDNQEY